MRYSGYGVGELGGPTEPRQPARARPKGLAAEDRLALDLPRGVTEREATFLLEIFARLKAKRFGRVEVTVREGSVTSVEFVEKVDRNLFRLFSG